MSIICDCHIHSNFSGDAQDILENMVKAGIKKGFKRLCFTEHMDFLFPYEPGQPEMFTVNTDSYLYELLRVRSKYEDQIKVCFGVELGLQTDAVKENAVYAKCYDFDMIIASLHLVDKVDPYHPEYFMDKTEEEAYGLYFTRIYENLLRFSNFDTLGHLDYIIRYGENKDKNYRYEIYKATIDKILEFLIENEKALEINTGGIRKGVRDVHPALDILKKYKSMGGELITIGSDAHNVSDIGSDFSKAEEALRECGFKYYCAYENRVAEFIKL